MSKKKKQNREQKLARKCAVESLRFQVHFGLKMLGREDDDLFHKLAETEINFIDELDLIDDILQIKRLVEGVKINLQVEPTSKKEISVQVLLLSLWASQEFLFLTIYRYQ